ncbi:hypothetical protein ES708_08258 [subsurface metagenome]
MKINKKIVWSLHRLVKKSNDKKEGKSIKEKTIIKKKAVI